RHAADARRRRVLHLGRHRRRAGLGRRHRGRRLGAPRRDRVLDGQADDDDPHEGVLGRYAVAESPGELRAVMKADPPMPPRGAPAVPAKAPPSDAPGRPAEPAASNVVSLRPDAQGKHSPAHALAPGLVIAGKYRLERLLRRGGMGSVWVATHLGLTTSIAIK